MRARGRRLTRGRLPPPARGRHLAPQPAAAPSPIVSRPSVGGPLRGIFIPPCRPSCLITGNCAHWPLRPQPSPKIRPWRFTLRAGAPPSHNCGLMDALRDYTQGSRIRHHKPSYATLAFNATGCLVIDPFAFPFAAPAGSGAGFGGKLRHGAAAPDPATGRGPRHACGVARGRFGSQARPPTLARHAAPSR
jgi:hypothetical protein